MSAQTEETEEYEHDHEECLIAREHLDDYDENGYCTRCGERRKYLYSDAEECDRKGGDHLDNTDDDGDCILCGEGELEVSEDGNEEEESASESDDINYGHVGAAINASLLLEIVDKRYCGAGTERYREVECRCVEAWEKLSESEKDECNILLSTDDDGYTDKRWPKDSELASISSNIVETRSRIMVDVISKTVQMLERRKNGESALRNDGEDACRIHSVEEKSPREYGRRANVYVDCFVRLAFPAPSAEEGRGYEHIWVQVVDEWDPKDADDTDQLEGVIHSAPLFAEASCGDLVTFKVSEITDVFTAGGDTEAYNSSRTDRSYGPDDVAKIFEYVQRSTNPDLMQDIWDNLTDKERLHAGDISDFIKRRAARTNS